MLASAPPIRPSSSSACTGPGRSAPETSHKGVDVGGHAQKAGVNGPVATLPSRSSRFQSFGEQLLVPKNAGTGLSSSQSGPLPTVEGLSSHGSSKGIVMNDSPDGKSGGLPPMSKAAMSVKAPLSRPASTAALPFVPNAIGLTGAKRISAAGAFGEDALQKFDRASMGSKQRNTGEQASLAADSRREHTGQALTHSAHALLAGKPGLPSMSAGSMSEAAYDPSSPPRKTPQSSPSLVPLSSVPPDFSLLEEAAVQRRAEHSPPPMADRMSNGLHLPQVASQPGISMSMFHKDEAEMTLD